MKRYNFYIFLLMLFFNRIAFCDVTDSYSVVLFDRNDVAKYWLIKQLGEKHNKDVFNSRINNLLVACKKLIEMSRLDFFNTKEIASTQLENGWIYFCFDNGAKFKDLDFSIMNRPIPFVIPRSLSINLKPHAGQQTDMSYMPIESTEKDKKFLLSPIVLSYSQQNAKQLDEARSIDELLIIPLKYRYDRNKRWRFSS